MAIRITNDAKTAPGHLKEPINVFCLELYEEDGKNEPRLVAYRLLPKEAQFTINPKCSFQFQWVMNLIQEEPV